MQNMNEYVDMLKPLLQYAPLLMLPVVFGLLWWFKLRSKQQVRSQESHLHTEDGRIVPIKMDVLYGCISHDAWEEAWAMHQTGLCPGRGTNPTVMVINEREAQPFNLAGGTSRSDEKTKLTIWELVKDIVSEARKRSHSHLEKTEQKNVVADTLQISVLALMGCFALALIFTHFQSGGSAPPPPTTPTPTQAATFVLGLFG